jgi:trigger factor
MVWDFYRQNPQALAEIRAPLFEEKVVDHILTKAKVTDVTVSAEALLKEDDEEDADKPKAKSKAKSKAAKEDGDAATEAKPKAAPKSKAKKAESAE